MTGRLIFFVLIVMTVAALALWFPVEVALGWRTAFLTLAVPILGAGLMLTIGEVVVADWRAFTPLANLWPLSALFALPIVAVQIAAPTPAHLLVWMHPLFVLFRAMAAIIGFGFSVAALASRTRLFAAILLAVSTWAMTPLGADWMLGMSPGHPFSAIGMMLAVEAIGGACALFLLLDLGDAALRRDMSRLMIAAALGLAYLAFMDYLVVWYGDLPERARWYVPRVALVPAILAGMALLSGLIAPLALLARRDDGRGRFHAALLAMAGLFLFNLWFVGAGPVGALTALLLAGALWTASQLALRYRREAAHG